MADNLWMPRPAICDLGGEIIEIDAMQSPNLVDRLYNHWDTFLGATIRVR